MFQILEEVRTPQLSLGLNQLHINKNIAETPIWGVLEMSKTRRGCFLTLDSTASSIQPSGCASCAGEPHRASGLLDKREPWLTPGQAMTTDLKSSGVQEYQGNPRERVKTPAPSHKLLPLIMVIPILGMQSVLKFCKFPRICHTWITWPGERQ